MRLTDGLAAAVFVAAALVGHAAACGPGSCSKTFGCGVGFFGHNKGCSCQPADPGSYCPRSWRNDDSRTRCDRSCSKCPAGKSSNGAGAKVCKKCPPAKYSFKGASSCTNCAAGWYNPKSGQPGCWRCSPGTFSAANSPKCTVCPPGKFADSLASSTCTECKMGTYFENRAGSDKAAPGAKASASCVACPEGRFGTAKLGGCEGGKCQGVEKVCQVCPAGKFQINAGATKCTTCPVGQYQNEPARLDCKQCQEGTIPSQDKRSCVPYCTKCETRDQFNECMKEIHAFDPTHKVGRCCDEIGEKCTENGPETCNAGCAAVLRPMMKQCAQGKGFLTTKVVPKSYRDSLKSALRTCKATEVILPCTTTKELEAYKVKLGQACCTDNPHLCDEDEIPTEECNYKCEGTLIPMQKSCKRYFHDQNTGAIAQQMKLLKQTIDEAVTMCARDETSVKRKVKKCTTQAEFETNHLKAVQKACCSLADGNHECDLKTHLPKVCIKATHATRNMHCAQTVLDMAECATFFKASPWLDTAWLARTVAMCQKPGSKPPAWAPAPTGCGGH